MLQHQEFTKKKTIYKNVYYCYGNIWKQQLILKSRKTSKFFPLPPTYTQVYLKSFQNLLCYTVLTWPSQWQFLRLGNNSNAFKTILSGGIPVCCGRYAVINAIRICKSFVIVIKRCGNDDLHGRRLQIVDFLRPTKVDYQMQISITRVVCMFSIATTA